MIVGLRIQIMKYSRLLAMKKNHTAGLKYEDSSRTAK